MPEPSTQDNDLYRIEHMISFCEKIQMYAREVESLADGPTELHILGLLRLFETLGEAASKVSKAFKQSHPNIPWRQAISMRGRLIHGYDGLDYSVLWLTIEDDIPPLYEELLKARMELHSK